MTMRQRIAKHELALRDPNLGFIRAFGARIRLFFTYIQYALVHSFTLLFLHPSKSFVALNDPTSDGLWHRSYIEHLAFRNQVRFASLSGFFVLLTASAATFAIVITIFPDRGVSPVYAAALSVNSSNDLDDGTCDASHCSLREAIDAANSNSGSDTITFSGGPYAIQITSRLPILTDNGTTIQGGGLIGLNGASAGSGIVGLDIQADNITIQGLDIGSFSDNGINISSTSDNITIGGSGAGEGNNIFSNGGGGISINGGTGYEIIGNNIGQKSDGTLNENDVVGILITGGSNISIGDASSTQYITDGINIGSNASEVTLYGNVIGMSSAGLTGGLQVNGATLNGDNITFGGTGAGQRNYIVAGTSQGVDAGSTASGLDIIGNYIGVSPDGTSNGNAGHGIKVASASTVTISSNVVAGSSLNGLHIDSISSGTNLISSNTIGVLPSGASGANSGSGIYAETSSNLTISENTIGFNLGSGIEFEGTSATVTKNYVGLSAINDSIPNGKDGITLKEDSTGCLIGGSIGDKNFIGNNGNAGIKVSSSVSGSPTISYNYIGVSVDGTAVAPNLVGIIVAATSDITNNVVSGNEEVGIVLDSDNNTITSNIVGLNATGEAALGNGLYGIHIGAGQSSNSIGLTEQGNIVAGNGEAQILVDTASTDNSIVGNYIGCDITCTSLINPSAKPALGLQGSVNTTVIGNYFGGNTDQSGTTVGTSININSGATGTIIKSNYIGQGTDGSDIAGDGLIGILVHESDGQTIGTIDAGNTIANFVTGIELDGSEQVSMRGNNFSGNTTNVSFLNDANQSVEPPVIRELAVTGASGTSAVSGSVDLYEDGMYKASGESDGTWEIETNLDVAKTITATITDSDGNTSDFGDFSSGPGGDTTAPVSSAAPAGGTYSGTQSITLSATDDTDVAPRIFYTTDGSTPTESSTLYTEAISIVADTTLNFFAVDNAENAEEVHTEVYDIKQDQGGVVSTENIRVKVNGETIHPECASCTVRIEDTTPTFLGLVSKSFIDYIVRLVIFAAAPQEDGTTTLDKVFAENTTIIQNPKNTENALWKITVPEEQALDLGEYVVKVGLRDPDGAVVKPMRKQVTLAVTPPDPVVVSPQALVYTETPTFIGNALNDSRIIARVFQDEVEVGYCQADVVNGEGGTGSFACSLPFDLKVGQYTARINTQDLVSELISQGSEVMFSVSRPVPVLDNVPFSLVSGEVSIQSQYLTTDNTPVFVGLATNDTEVVLVIDGTLLFPANLTNDDSGVGNWDATTSFLEDGIHTAYAVVRSDGVEVSRTDTLQFRIVAPSVRPIIISPVDGARFALGRQIIFTVLGHSGDTAELSLDGSTDISVTSVFSADPSGTGRATFTFSNGLPRGPWVATAVATDSTGKPSLPSDPVSIRVFVPVVTPPTPTIPSDPVEQPTEEPIEEPTNTNEPPVNTNGELTNTNEVPTNTNETPTNVNGVPVNTNETPVNTNEIPTNTNEVPTGNVNETPTETPEEERQPLPEPPPAFSFPEGVEHFPIVDKTPEDLTSEEVAAVRLVLNSYLRSELQILPAEQEGNALYLVTEKTADNQPVLTVSQEVGLETSPALTNTLNSVLRIFGFQQFKQTENVLIFRGTTIPYATVKLTIFSDPIVKIAQADADGRWTMTVAADSLPPGDHSAYVQTSYGEATSDEVQIARFVVVQQERLSNTTWLFIINLGVILVVLLAAIFLQLRKRTQLLEIKKTAIPVESPWNSGSVKLPKKEDQNKKPKGPDDLGDIMGI